MEWRELNRERKPWIQILKKNRMEAVKKHMPKVRKIAVEGGSSASGQTQQENDEEIHKTKENEVPMKEAYTGDVKPK